MIERGQPDTTEVAAWRRAKVRNRRAVLLVGAAAERGMTLTLKTARDVVDVIDACERDRGRAEWLGSVQA